MIDQVLSGKPEKGFCRRKAFGEIYLLCSKVCACFGKAAEFVRAGVEIIHNMDFGFAE